MKRIISPHTSTHELKQIRDAKVALLNTWEEKPDDALKPENRQYIMALTRRIRQINAYLSHRKDLFV